MIIDMYVFFMYIGMFCQKLPYDQLHIEIFNSCKVHVLKC